MARACSSSSVGTRTRASASRLPWTKRSNFKQYVCELVGPFTHLWFESRANFFAHLKLIVKKKIAEFFGNVPIQHAAARVLARKNPRPAGASESTATTRTPVILLWRLRQVPPQLALQ